MFLTMFFKTPNIVPTMYLTMLIAHPQMAPLRQHMKKRPWTLWQVGCLKAISVKNHHLITIGKTNEPRARRTVNKISAARFLKLFMKLLVLNLDVLSFPFQLLKNRETDFNFTFISQGQSFISLSKKRVNQICLFFQFSSLKLPNSSLQ